jgi:hypothetical protein
MRMCNKHGENPNDDADDDVVLPLRPTADI